MHAAFFLGYFVMNFPAAYLGLYFNLKKLLLVSLLVNAMLTCITPFLINFTYSGTSEFLLRVVEWTGTGNWKALVVLRVIQGIIQVHNFLCSLCLRKIFISNYHQSMVTLFVAKNYVFIFAGFHVSYHLCYKCKMVSSK